MVILKLELQGPSEPVAFVCMAEAHLYDVR